MKKEEDFKDLLKLSEHSLRKFWGNKEDEMWDSYLNKSLKK